MKYLKAVLGVAVLVILDQITKWWAASSLQGNEAIVVIKNIFELQYLENRGIAFGLFQNKYIIFVITTFVILGIIAYFYWKMPIDKKYSPIRMCLVILTAGAIGNLIDRVVHNYVIDFLYVKCIDFPIFNVADCYVTVSMIILILLVVFYYKEEELVFHKNGTKSN